MPDLQINELVEIFIVLLIGAVVFLFVVNAAGGLSGLVDKFCAEFPQFCGQQAQAMSCEEDPDCATALYSMKALACAVKSTQFGHVDSCVSDFQDRDKAWVECNFKDGYQISQTPSRWQKFKQWVASWFKKPEPPEGCVVHNFKLPQKVSDAEEWIAGYGDPKFIGYHQYFPDGEDKAWRGYTTWMENVGTVVLFAIPTERLFVAGKRWVFTKVGKLFEEVGGVTARNMEKSLIKAGVDESDRLMVFDRAMSKAERISALQSTKIAEQVGKEVESKVSPSMLNTIKKTAKVTTPVALGAALIDSINEKYKPYYSNLVLKQPYVEPITIPSTNIPVVLDKRGWMLKLTDKNFVNFYEASPCDADLRTYIGAVFCKEYHKDANGVIYCAFSNAKDVCEQSKNELGLEIGDCDEDPLSLIPMCGNDDTANFDPVNMFVVGTRPTNCAMTSIMVYPERKDGFCYTTPSKWTAPIFVGTLIADALTSYFSAGILTEVSVGVTGGVLYTLTEQAEKWPGS